MPSVETPPAPPPRILVADDDPISRRRLETCLKKRGYEVVSVQDGNEAWAVLSGPDAPGLAILDWMMPGMDGPEICAKLRSAKQEPYVYVMLLTGRDSHADLISGMDAGADDYLTKPYKSEELEVRLRAGRRIVELQRDLIVARERLRFQASHDSVTSVYNRAAITEHLERELARARREAHPLSVVMLDLDHFKRVNDTFGHAAGDAVLRQSAERFKGLLRGYDVVGRYGGEEFVVILPSCSADGAHLAAERLRSSLAQSPIATDAYAIAITCSVGVATAVGPAELDATALLGRADAALYEAKRLGRNRVAVAPSVEQPRASAVGQSTAS